MEMLPPDQEALAVRKTGSDRGILTKMDGCIVWLTRIPVWISMVILAALLIIFPEPAT